MNRTYKFRAWNGGDMTYLSETMASNVHLYMTNHSWGVFNGEDDFSVCNRAYGGILMEYTGLKDINSIEIYVGDIVEVTANKNIRGVVRFGLHGDHDCEQGYYIEWNKNLFTEELRCELGYWSDKISVVGDEFRGITKKIEATSNEKTDNPIETTSKMAEFVCDRICKWPDVLFSKDELEDKCADCKLDKFICSIMKNNLPDEK